MPQSKVLPPTDLKYRRVELAGLDRGRRGKHHDLVVGILQELEALSQNNSQNHGIFSDILTVTLVPQTTHDTHHGFAFFAQTRFAFAGQTDPGDLRDKDLKDLVKRLDSRVVG